MDAGYFRTLFDYSCWARDRILAAAEGLSDEDFARPNGFTYGSIRGILTHALAAEVNAAKRWRGETPSTFLRDGDLASVPALAERWREHEASLRPWLEGLKDEDLARELVSRRRDGSEYRRLLWQDMAHIATHTVQHRSEAAEALTMVGRSPGDLDMMVYFLAHQPRVGA